MKSGRVASPLPPPLAQSCASTSSSVRCLHTSRLFKKRKRCVGRRIRPGLIKNRQEEERGGLFSPDFILFATTVRGATELLSLLPSLAKKLGEKAKTAGNLFVGRLPARNVHSFAQPRTTSKNLPFSSPLPPILLLPRDRRGPSDSLGGGGKRGPGREQWPKPSREKRANFHPLFKRLFSLLLDRATALLSIHLALAKRPLQGRLFSFAVRPPSPFLRYVLYCVAPKAPGNAAPAKKKEMREKIFPSVRSRGAHRKMVGRGEQGRSKLI